MIAWPASLIILEGANQIAHPVSNAGRIIVFLMEVHHPKGYN
jgi:hypothetical protein